MTTDRTLLVVLNPRGASCVTKDMDGGGGHALAVRRPVLTTTRTDDESFAALFAAHHGEAVRLAYLLCGDAARAEDVVGDAFVKLYRRWNRGGIDNPRAYLRRAVVNETNSWFRRRAVERREAAKRSGDDRGVRGADDHVTEHAALVGALAALPHRQRTAVVLRYFNDLSERDTAELMGVSVGTVKSSVSRALDRLRDALDEEVS
jgi:RNA polymerase sigma-70 factor (sigma-E family)